MSSFEKSKDELLIKEKFYSSLTCKKISDKEYEYVLKIWNAFQVKTIKDCHNLYWKYVLLLADVFEKLLNNSLNNDGLCPSD